MTCALPETTGLIAVTPGIAAMASASLALRLLLLPAPLEAPPFRVLPG